MTFVHYFNLYLLFEQPIRPLKFIHIGNHSHFSQLLGAVAVEGCVRWFSILCLYQKISHPVWCSRIRLCVCVCVLRIRLSFQFVFKASSNISN